MGCNRVDVERGLNEHINDSGFFRTKDDPTLGSFIFEQALALKKAGNNVYIVYCDTYSVKYLNDYYHYQEEALSVEEGIVIIRDRAFCPLKHNSGFYGTKETFTRHIIKLYKKYLTHVKIDIIHAHCCAWAGIAAKRLSCMINVPYVITEHSTLYALSSELIKGMYKREITDAFLRAKAVICVSQGLAKIIRKYNQNVMVIGNVIDCDLFALPGKEDNNNDFKFGHVCEMVN